ncbi:MAG: sialidase family protein [Bryobacteraceae bacterium]
MNRQICLLLITVGATQAAELTIGDGKQWSFAGGEWTQNAGGVIRPPDRRNLHSRAFYTGQSFSDVTAEFDYNPDYRETGTGNAGLILRASDSAHFYVVHFPWGGQQLRAKHFWAGIAKVDGDGYLRNLRFGWVPGLPSETDRWYHVKVVAKGPLISVWVDGIRAAEVSDASYRSGHVGLLGYGWYAFRNVKVAGASAPAPKWNRSIAVESHARDLPMTSAEMPSNCVAPNGDVLLAAGETLIRSRDKGRTWGAAEALPGFLGKVGDYGSSMFRTNGGRLLVMVYRSQAATGQATPEILISESADNGRTWSTPAASLVAGGWPAVPKNLSVYGPLVETADGGLLRFLYGGMGGEGSPPDALGRVTNVVSWGSVHCKAFAIRSTDGGKSWSAPIEVDQPSWADRKRGTILGSLDLTEPTGVAIGNKVLVLIRPIYSSTMWQCRSADGGANWDAAARATFPGYAQSMVRSRAGAIAVAHRFPNYALNLSTDDGLHWDDGTIIDYPAWAMGTLVEVEPNVLLATYMNTNRKMPLLYQLIRITPQGVRPEFK